MRRSALLSVLLAGLLGALAVSAGSVAGATTGLSNPDLANGHGTVSAPAKSSQTEGTVSMRWDGVAPNPTTYYLDPLIKNKTQLSGTVEPPNTECPGTISGTLVKGKLSLTITYPGTECAGDQANLSGRMSVKKGTTSGKFTANYHCPSSCSFKGTKT